MGTAYYAAHRYADAISTFEGSKNSYPDDPAWLAASYAQLGQVEQAHKVMSEFLSSAEVDSWWTNAPKSAARIERDPTGFLRYMAYMYPFMDQADRDHHIDGLRKAGLPE
jgi:predicted Zn-dependent protease